jgi:hypothetical protein
VRENEDNGENDDQDAEGDFNLQKQTRNPPDFSE